MSHFVSKMVAHLKQHQLGGASLFQAQLLKRLFLHSDNAAQHFKSSKSLHWLSKQRVDMNLVSITWDFGPPGHGKVLQSRTHACMTIFFNGQGRVGRSGGMLKQWIKQRKLSRLAVDPNDNSMPCPVAHPIGSLMASAEECYCV